MRGYPKLVEVLGEAAASALCAARGGRAVYIPESGTGALGALLSPEQVDRMRGAFGGRLPFTVPMGPCSLREIARRRGLELLAEDWTPRRCRPRNRGKSRDGQGLAQAVGVPTAGVSGTANRPAVPRPGSAPRFSRLPFPSWPAVSAAAPAPKPCTRCPGGSPPGVRPRRGSGCRQGGGSMDARSVVAAASRSSSARSESSAAMLRSRIMAASAVIVQEV